MRDGKAAGAGKGRPAAAVPPSTRRERGLVAAVSTRPAAESKYEKVSAGTSRSPEVSGTTTNSQVREPEIPEALGFSSLFTCGG